MPDPLQALPDGAEIQLSDALFSKIAEFLNRRTGILLKEYKKYLVVSRLSRMVGGGSRFATFQALYEALLSDANGSLVSEFVNALTTNYSFFFRDSVHFQLLEEYLRDRAGKEDYLRIWSAASSSGEEAFSIAITLLENRSLLPSDTKILATDISTKVLNKAELGIYPVASVDPRVPAGAFRRFFEILPGGTDCQVKPEVRDMVSFRYLNLLSEYPFKKEMDVIFLRNVLIYFGMDEKREVVRRAYERLKPGGYLVIGLSESLVGVETPLRMCRNSIYQKHA